LKTQKEIFISYAWGGESENIVNEICAAFEESGYKITRDKSDLTYRQSIKDFMKSIGMGSFIIAVISDKYLHSEYCMYEAYRIFQAPDEFRQRVYPIVLEDAELFSFDGQKKYLQFWMDETERLKKEIGEMAGKNPTMVIGLTERLRDYELTARYVNDFIATISDMNVISPEHHRSTNFRSLVEQMEAQLPTEDHKTEEKNNSIPNQSAFGGMNIGGDLNTGGDDISIDGVRAGSNVAAGKGGSVNITGENVIGSINASDHAKVDVTQSSVHKTEDTDFEKLFELLEEKIKTRPEDPNVGKQEIQKQVNQIKNEVAQGEKANPNKIERWIRNLFSMAPDVVDVMAASFGGPISGLAAVIQKIAARVKAETESTG
jgi:hypothetical protein